MAFSIHASGPSSKFFGAFGIHAPRKLGTAALLADFRTKNLVCSGAGKRSVIGGFVFDESISLWMSAVEL